MTEKTQQEHKEREHFFNAAKMVALVTLLCRVFGMLRDIAVTSLGANRATDAFGLAYKIPNLFRRLFGEGALTSSFVPVFTEVSEKDGFEKSSKLLANALALLALFLSLIMLILQIGFLIVSILPGPEDRKLLMILAAIMIPYMVTVCMLALGSAALNCRGKFVFSSAAPIIFNIIGIISAWWIAPLMNNINEQLYIVAIGVTVAGVIQLLAVLWLLKKNGFSIRLRLLPIEPGINLMLKLLAPMLLGLGLLQISELTTSAIAWILTVTPDSSTINIFGMVLDKPLKEGVIIRLSAANALYQFPMGVLAISLGVAVFPLLTRYAARGDMENLRDSINRAMRISLMEGIATGAGLFVLAEPIMKLIYTRRNFTEADALQSAAILKMYVLGMWAYCSYQILARSFYSLKDTKTPLKVSCSLVFLSIFILLALVWIPGFGPRAFGLATSITFSINVITLMYLLRRKVGRFGGKKIAICIIRSIFCAIAMACVVYSLRWKMANSPNWLVVLVCITAGAGTYIGTMYLIGYEEIGLLFGSLKKSRDIKNETPPNTSSQ
jgi:putative peptidoglycan lipid II flippase